MKHITKIIPVICFFVVTPLFIFFADATQSTKFSNITGMKKDYIDISYSDEIKINSDIIEKFLKLAKEKNIIVEKINTSPNNLNEKNVYLSFDTTDELYNFLNKNFKIKKLNKNVTNDSNLFFSTYEHNSKEQIGLIPDLLNNNKYNYYTFANLFENNGNLYGPYILYYDNYSNYSYFINEVESLLGPSMNINYIFSLNNSSNYIMLLIMASVVIIMLFYFVFQIYEVYYKSKEIGCMRLLGFSKEKITKILIKKRINVYLIIVLIILLSTMFIKNISPEVLIGIMFINLLLILLTYLIIYFCIGIILRGYKTSNIIKKQNIAIKISKVNNKLKIIVMIFLLMLISVFFNIIVSLQSSIKIYNNNKDLFDYGVIATLNGMSENNYNYEKHSDFYKYIMEDDRLNTFYAEFSSRERDPDELTDEEKELFDKWEEEGTFFVYNSVDRNYLIKENIKIYDLNENIVDLRNIDGIFFLFPKSKKDKIEKFESYYKNYSKKDYEKYNIDTEFKSYLYDDQKLNTYSTSIDLKYIDSPILRVINEDLRISYIESPLGLSIFGISLNTGLKIEIGENRNETYKALEENIIKAGLEDYISVDDIIAYSDYFSNEIQIYQTVFLISIVAILVLISIYTIISIQTISLYVKVYNRMVIVKYLLGFNKNDIFDNIIKNNVKYNIIAFILTAFLLYVFGIFNLLMYLLSISTFLLIDFIVMNYVIKTYNFANIYIKLKGGNYD